MKIGEMRSVLEFQNKIEVPNETRGVDIVWQTAFTTRGQITAPGGRSVGEGSSYTKYQTAEPVVTTIITIRYRDDIERGMRIHSNGINYNIINQSLDNTARPRWIKIACEEEKSIV